MTNSDESNDVLVGAIPESASGSRLDKVMPSVFPPYSRSQLQVWLKQGRILMGDSIPSPRLIVSGGEVLSLAVPELPSLKWAPEDLHLSIEYEDADLVVINKPAGLVVHPGAGNGSGTLANAILYRYPNTASLPRAGIVHRLDKDTSGLIVVALSERARGYLIKTLERREVVREYLAVVNGCPISGGNIDAPIGRHPRDRIKMAVTETGKSAETQYRVLKRFRSHSLLGLKLKSGRTHQIRVHMTHLGFPLVGDSLYGSRVRIPSQASDQVIDALRKFGRQALHATQLGFDHPVSGESLLWTSPMPADMDLLTKALSEDAEQTCF